MKFGFIFPGGSARRAGEMARLAEDSGWDGFFVWEAPWATDAWVALAAAAMTTRRIRLGTMVTPLPALQPWKLAAQTATLDELSGGRLTLSVGLGATDTGWPQLGLPTNRKLRAELLDEGLDILTGLWRGQPFEYHGKHFTLQPITFPKAPAPIQQPRIPIWVVGAWKREKSLRRALRYEGIIPAMMGAQGKVETRAATPEEIHQISHWLNERRENPAPLDIVVEGKSSVGEPAPMAYAQAGATWWLEALWDAPDEETVFHRLEAGPPKAEVDNG